MNREEALAEAVSVVEKIGNSPDLNPRGYKVDGWKPPTLAERVEAIKVLAEFLTTPEPVGRVVAPEPVCICPGSAPFDDPSCPACHPRPA